VHKNIDCDYWSEANVFEPPFPNPIPGEGFPTFHIELDDFEFCFASLDEISHCIEVLSQKLLPRSIDLSRQRGTVKGPNTHWLSRLPASVKSWKYREKAVKYMQNALQKFQQEIENR